MGKDKLRRFAENLSFERLFQPVFEEIYNRDYVLKGRWHEIFGNDNPIVLELGCGRGEYTVALAKKFPDRNFIGIDVKGARLWRGAKTIHENRILNAAFLRIRIDFICSCFARDEVSEIWITFPDPQPRKENKRLSSPRFVARYKTFMKTGGMVHLKTDNLPLHEYTKKWVTAAELPVYEHYTDIQSQCSDELLLNIQTHYEEMFSAQGFPITYLKFGLLEP
ncbi:MAG: tRNA (guanosine(46)-N7)-methyltransferase TrmB [Prevotellaceae bacterium]|jgi:tRNA (guanine-N7-)-methyltransferase|nr:tRNA (guanosine(46)-N7)-methyltransferase TrmB [Prevotellaceae bacterium]